MTDEDLRQWKAMAEHMTVIVDGELAPDVVMELIAEVERLRAELTRERLNHLTTLGQCTEEHVWPGHPRYPGGKREEG